MFGEHRLIAALHGATEPLVGAAADFDPLLAMIGDARFVLLGEATHGTHEFYRIRGEVTKRLIREHGFSAVAVEGDWPDAYRVNRYIQGRSADADAGEALEGFQRFPQWMWRNADVLDFIGWLREHNDGLEAKEAKVGWYGLDLNSLHTSMGAVIEYLKIVDPGAAERAARRYACFDHFGEEPQSYGYATTIGMAPSCETEVLRQLVDLRRAATEYARRDGRVAPDDYFFAERNATLVASAEQYYRTMFRGRAESWNVRDQHMADTLAALSRFLQAQGRSGKVVVWAHNSHVGDARATEMGARGELNLGQLVRERWRDPSVLVGFTTFSGTVSAASDWGTPVERKSVRPALPQSYESIFHQCDRGNFLLNLRAKRSTVVELLRVPRLERAIGVIYQPTTERASHYFACCLPQQFDAVLHYDHTRAVEPLERTARWEAGEELPETYPFAL